jgi:hypothetical protein
MLKFVRSNCIITFNMLTATILPEILLGSHYLYAIKINSVKFESKRPLKNNSA